MEYSELARPIHLFIHSVNHYANVDYVWNYNLYIYIITQPAKKSGKLDFYFYFYCKIKWFLVSQ